MSVFKLLQSMWDAAQSKEAQAQQEPVPAPEVGHAAPLGHCAWVGVYLLGNVGGDLATDVARLKAIMWETSIRPYLCAEGGSGFDYPHNPLWIDANWPLVQEFERLWFSPAGDEIIRLYGHRMQTRTLPAPLPDPDPATATRLRGSSAKPLVQGSGQA